MDKMDEIIWMIRQEMRRKKVHSKAAGEGERKEEKKNG